MMTKIKTALKSPAVWVALVVGIVLATAFSMLRKPAKVIASKLPGNDVAA
jgi:hypothetical protein